MKQYIFSVSNSQATHTQCVNNTLKIIEQA